MKSRMQDRRVRKNIVLDTETAPYYEKVKPYECKGFKSKDLLPKDAYNIEEYTYKDKTYYKCMTKTKQTQLIFDIGWVVCDNYGNILVKRNFLVEEVFTNMDLMRHAHYFSKYSLYLKMIQNGHVKMTPWITIMRQMEDDIIQFNVKRLFAYNMAFDKKAIYETARIIGKRKPYFFDYEGVRFHCLWGMACETILLRKTFFKIAKENNWFSEAGNIKTSAEVCYRFISNNYDFEESHTALDDSIIETAILAKILRAKQKMSWGIISQPWRIVQEYGKARGWI